MSDINKRNKSKNAPWVIVAGGVNRLGGTDKANFALVKYLLENDVPVHVVTHQLDEELLRYPTLHAQLVTVPGGSWLLGEKLLSFQGRRLAKIITASHPEARVIVNGGNCLWGDVNWVHRVHHAWAPESVDAPSIHRLKHHVAVATAKRREIRSLRAARLIIANSELTRRHLIELVGIESEIVHAVRLGSESEWVPATCAERIVAREDFLQAPQRPMVTFIGAIGYDNNKGLDTLLSAWCELCRHPEWDADLVVAGSGRALARSQAMVEHSDLRSSVRFLGFTHRVPELLAAADLLVSPVRYESYGLNVQESLCRGVPAIVSAGAGVAEVYPSHLRNLLLPDPEDVADLVHRMLMWRSNLEYWRERVVEYSRVLRKYSWRNMAERFHTIASGIVNECAPDRMMIGGSR